LKIKQREKLLLSSKNPQEITSRFSCYQDFLNNTKPCSFYPLRNMYQTNTSFITYEKIKKQSNPCESLVGDLYPYGTYVSDNIPLYKWCPKKTTLCDLSYYIDPSLLNK